MKILAIETSCDETSAAVVESNSTGGITILSNVVASSMDLHAKTGGIIPEVAARNQITYIVPVIKQALGEANIPFDGKNPPTIDALALTYGPGLIGSLLVGVETVKTLSYVWDKPLIPVNHLFGHIYANWIQDTASTQELPQFPAIALVVSGGHTDLVLMKSHTDITWLGGTRDDAAGEAFDKCARLLGYNYPGGPKISQLALEGSSTVFPLPRPMLGSNDYDFSFSGLKTAFLNKTKEHFPILRKSIDERAGWQQVPVESNLSEKEKQVLYNLCASLQDAIIDVLLKKTIKAAREYNVTSILLAGGVSANQKLREEFAKKCEDLNFILFAPQKKYCMDNAAMIGAAAYFRQQYTPWQDVAANPELYFD